MRYLSTRGLSLPVTAARALLDGAAPDGGLYLMDSLPDLSPLLRSGGDYATLAAAVFRALLPGLDGQGLEAAAQAAYGPQFDTPAITPLRAVGDAFVLELFHGPTAAFKDLALQALPRLMALAREQVNPGLRYTVLAATSGDTGSAAMRGFLDMPGFQTLVYYPKDGVSAVQERQMAALSKGNARAVAIRGNFDDAQSALKAAFPLVRAQLPAGQELTFANSINIGRLVPQVAYYLGACRSLLSQGRMAPGDTADFIVPTGNFGNILAGLLAKRMGAPIGQLVCASNANDVLADFLETGRYDRRRALKKTLSPSMDILVSSNLERLLYLASGGDAALVNELMSSLQQQGHYTAPDSLMKAIRRDFEPARADDRQALSAIRAVWYGHRCLLDPHTATAWAALPTLPARSRVRVLAATASPFKFPDAVFQALGIKAAGNPEDSLRRLAEEVRQPIPRALFRLGEAKAPPVIDKDGIAGDILSRVKAW